MPLIEEINRASVIYLKQRVEFSELAGFETRNKYAIEDADGAVIGFAAERNDGIAGFMMRQFLGHWRSFHITFFNRDREPAFIAQHPFRFFFQRLEVLSPIGERIGALQQRFAFFRKVFEVEDAHGRVILTMSSRFFQFWTFPFYREARRVGVVEKKWSGAMKEFFTDADHFRIRFEDPGLSEEERCLLLAGGVFVDLQYFERKAGNR